MKVVLIDSQPAQRKKIKTYFEKEEKRDWSIKGASDGEKGLELIKKEKPDLIVMDLDLPKMTGIEVLKKVREMGINSKVILCTKITEPSQLQEAIALSVHGYLVKPFREKDMAALMDHIRKNMRREQDAREIVSLDEAIVESIAGRLTITRQLQDILKRDYNFSVARRFYAIMVYLGEGYDTMANKTKKILTDAAKKKEEDYSCHVVKSEEHKLVLGIIYGVKNEQAVRDYFENTVVPKLDKNIDTTLICAWRRIPNLVQMNRMLAELENNLDWNLLFGKGVLISFEKIANLHITPLEYPEDVESRAKQAVLNRQPIQFREMMGQFGYLCRQQLHRPNTIKEMCIRFLINLLEGAKQYGYQEGDMNENLFQRIANAVTWQEINDVFLQMFHILTETGDKPESHVSPMIQKAMEIIRTEYQNGLTLKELAQKLYVSEEYLSAQFKKETGATFSATIRTVRLNKVKELLRTTRLKLGQIAEQTGYSDPKYMAKVFKEEVGMLPYDYRKIH